MTFWDREEVKIRINQLYRLNRDISYTGVLDEHPHLLFAAVNYFRNWGHAVTSSGIDYSKVRRHEVWSRKRVKKELMKLQREGVELSYNEFERKHPELLHAAQYHYGNWKNALSVIGIDYKDVKKPREWTGEKIIEEIKTLKDKGVDLSWRAMFRQGYGAVVSASQFFYGSWRKAISRAGIDYSKIRKREVWSAQRVIETIKELHRRGIELSHMKLRKAGYGKLTSMGCYYFPNWGRAIEAAGFDYSLIRKKPRIFEKIRERGYNGLTG